jgi:hypothetical protein
MTRILVLLVALAGCAAKIPAIPPTVVIAKRPETVPLPEPPATKELPVLDNWVEALEAGACATKPGIFMSEAKAARCKAYKVSYDELRARLQADSDEWKAQRELYETRLNQADQAIREAQPNWAQRHAFEMGFVGGAASILAGAWAISAVK